MQTTNVGQTGGDQLEYCSNTTQGAMIVILVNLEHMYLSNNLHFGKVLPYNRKLVLMLGHCIRCPT